MAENVIEFSIEAKDQFSKTFASAGAGVLKLGAAVLGVAGSFLAMTKAVANMQDRINDLHKRTGQSIQSLSELSHIADITNTSMDGLANGMRFLQRNMSMAGQGSIESVKAFRDLGVSTQQLKVAGDNVGATLGILADRFQQVQDPAERTRLAMQIFGKGGSEMLQVMAEGSDGLRKLAADAHYLGVVMGEQGVANAAEFNDQLDRVKGAVKGVSMAVSNEWIPVLTGFANAMVDVIVGWREPLREFSASMLKGFLVVYATFEAVFKKIAEVLKTLFGGGKGAAAMFDTLIENAKRAFMAIFDIAALALKSVGLFAVGAFKMLWESFVEIAKWAWQKVFDFFTGNDFADTLGTVLFERIAEATEKTRAEMKDVFKGVAPEWAAATSEGMDAVLNVFGTSKEQILARSQEIYDGLSMQGTVAAEKERADRQLTLLEQYQNMQTSLALREQELTAQIYFAQTTAEVWNSTLDLLYLKMQTYNQAISSMIMQTFEQLTSGIGEAVGRAIVMGEDLGTSLKKLMDQVLVSIISALVKMGVQRLIFMALNVGASATEASANLARGLAEVYTNSFASAAAIPYVGWMIAPGAASANLAIATAGAGAAGATGSALGAAIATPKYHTGVDFVPQEGLALLDSGERVLSPDQNKDFTEFMDAGGGSLVIQNLQIHVLENATNADSFMAMTENEIRELVARKFILAFDQLDRQGVRPEFAMRGRRGEA